MVGSGYSKNAIKLRHDAEDPPIWRNIAERIYRELYPEQATQDLDIEGVRGISADNALKLAQEYETAFGRTDLHRLLGQLVRDRDFEPGEFHFRLLRLPWRDVFTTNWDTLLERASEKIERSYHIVQNMKQLPLVSQPRIIQLHGALPSHFPLIFTEEDYRTYPTQYAPFVNTVQQAMMETVFCLIGFSGDDPNFLSWSGWVRDNFGEASPKIYLAGWLKLSDHRHRMLEDRGVIPIDLAKHPKAQSWPYEYRQQYATDWLLHTLEPSQPYDNTTWPSPPKQDEAVIPEYLQPVTKIRSEVPMEELERDWNTSAVPK